VHPRDRSILRNPNLLTVLLVSLAAGPPCLLSTTLLWQLDSHTSHSPLLVCCYAILHGVGKGVSLELVKRLGFRAVASGSIVFIAACWVGGSYVRWLLVLSPLGLGVLLPTIGTYLIVFVGHEFKEKALKLLTCGLPSLAMHLLWDYRATLVGPGGLGMMAVALLAAITLKE
jgi:hypothetical protein